MKRKDFLKSLAVGVPLAGAALQASAASQSALRTLDRVVHGRRTPVAPGLEIRRPLPAPGVRQVDPFLLLDHMEPRMLEPGTGPDVPPHPHRGFEPVTFVFDGTVDHKDSLGNHGELNSGDVQWMTAGEGIVHAEYMGKRMTERGRFHGVQLWVNLPKRHKMTKAGYQNIPAATIPVVSLDGGKASVRLIAGAAFGAEGPAKTFTRLMAMQVQLKPGASTALPVPASHNALAYVLEGAVTHGEKTYEAGNMLVYKRDGGQLPLQSASTANVLLLAGEPLNEPVASYGPFVMNTRAEINQAVADYQAGKMGTIDF